MLECTLATYHRRNQSRDMQLILEINLVATAVLVLYTPPPPPQVIVNAPQAG